MRIILDRNLKFADLQSALEHVCTFEHVGHDTYLASPKIETKQQKRARLEAMAEEARMSNGVFQ